jgi:hypothetical protein
VPQYNIRDIPVIGNNLKHAIYLFNSSPYASLANGGKYLPTPEEQQQMATEEATTQANTTNFYEEVAQVNTTNFYTTSFTQYIPTHNANNPLQWNTPPTEAAQPTPTEEINPYLPGTGSWVLWNSQHPKPKQQKEPKASDPNKTTISDIYKYKSLSKYIGLSGKLPIRAPTTFVGLEIELENVVLKSLPKSTWANIEDGSLKNNGREFVTIPIQFKYLEIELQRLFSGLSNYETTSRCSVHVHINARDFTLTELKSFIALYIIFEKSLYKYSGDRIHNNFCVPLIAYPILIKDFIKSLNIGEIRHCWFKYFGFNLSPIYGGESKPLGTIEFRHMKGTTNIPNIISWINLIVSLKVLAKKMPWSEIEEHIKTMNTTSGYYWLAEQVFGDFAPLITHQPTFKQDVEECISMTKTIFFSEEKNKYEEDIPLIHKKDPKHVRHSRPSNQTEEWIY